MIKVYGLITSGEVSCFGDSDDDKPIGELEKELSEIAKRGKIVSVCPDPGTTNRLLVFVEQRDGPRENWARDEDLPA